MIRTEALGKFRLAAIDLDGTLLGSNGKISQENARAVARLQDAGIHVALASGRHYINMRRYAEELPGVEWLISCQGGELSDVARKSVLSRNFLATAEAKETLERGWSLGFTALVYSVDGVLTDSLWNERIEFYAGLSGHPPQQIDRRKLLEREVFKILWLGETDGIEDALKQPDIVTERLQLFRTHHRLLEFMPDGVSKASALKVIAERLGVKPSEVIAFGDGDNDVPMFEWSGTSVAMPHGWPAALEKATYTAPHGSAEAALARGINLIFDS